MLGKGFVPFGLVLVIAWIGASPNIVRAQADSVCTPEAIQAHANVTIHQYETTIATATDTVNAISALLDLHQGIEAIIAKCTAEIESAKFAELTALYQDLQAGGYVIYVRHTHTDRTQQDTDLTQCQTQRNLSDLGRDQARTIYESYRQLNLPVSRLISTEYCRTHETALLAFGQPEIIKRTELEAELATLLATKPEAGTNWIIVAHIGSVTRVIGLPAIFEEGDALVYLPLGEDGFEFQARIAFSDWVVLAEIAQMSALAE